jgi:hypothetical protein
MSCSGNLAGAKQAAKAVAMTIKNITVAGAIEGWPNARKIV